MKQHSRKINLLRKYRVNWTQEKTRSRETSIKVGLNCSVDEKMAKKAWIRGPWQRTDGHFKS